MIGGKKGKEWTDAFVSARQHFRASHNPRVFIRMIIIVTALGAFSRIIAVLAADDK